MRRWSLAAAIVGVALLITSVRGQQQRQPAPRGKYVSDELLVKFSPTTPIGQRNGILRARSANRLRRFEHLDVDFVHIPAGSNMAAEP